MHNDTQRRAQKTFDMWVERMEMCIKFGGDYFEHTLK